MKQKDFYKLKCGQYVNGRKILKIGKIGKRTYFITLKKIRMSQYKGDTTVYVSGDAKVFKRTKKYVVT